MLSLQRFCTEDVRSGAVEIDKKEQELLEKLKENNSKCPYCGSNAIEEEKTAEYSKGIYSSVSACENKNCKARWREQYKIFEVTIYQESKNEVIEATQWFKNGDHPEDNCFRTFEDTGKTPTEPREGEVVQYFRHPDKSGESQCGNCGVIMHNHGWIETLEGEHVVCPGDWIITGVEGENYPCKPTVFAKTYEIIS